MQCWDLNPQPLKLESSCVTIRPVLQPEGDPCLPVLQVLIAELFFLGGGGEDRQQ